MKARACIPSLCTPQLLFSRLYFQQAQYTQWLDSCVKAKVKIAVLEIGAGLAIPAIRSAYAYVVCVN